MLNIKLSIFIIFSCLITLDAQDRGGITTLDKKPDSEPDEMTIALKKKLTYDWQLRDVFGEPINNWILSLREDGTFSSGDWTAMVPVGRSPFNPRPRVGTWSVEHGEKFSLVLKYSGGSPDLKLDVVFISVDQFKFPVINENNNNPQGELVFSRQRSTKESTNRFENKGFYFKSWWDLDMIGTGRDFANAKLRRTSGMLYLKKDMTFKWEEGSNVVESFWTFEVKDGQVYINTDKLGNYLVTRHMEDGANEGITLERQLESGLKEFLVLKRDKNF
jgi:hypothetical protein